LGKARKLFEGENIAIFSTAEITFQVFNAVAELNSAGLNPSLYQIHTIRPFDNELLNELSKKFNKFLVIDEHLPVGGLWNCFLEWKAETNASTRLSRLGPPEQFFFGNLDREELRKRYGYDKEAIIKFVKDNWSKT
jgi:transketolase C-terminal domain/subunit